jgi:hypothetical protein
MAKSTTSAMLPNNRHQSQLILIGRLAAVATSREGHRSPRLGREVLRPAMVPETLMFLSTQTLSMPNIKAIWSSWL